jgi:WhiB family redox-sensing transcriptional regulator
MDDAACREHPIDLFFPAVDARKQHAPGKDAQAQIAAAKQVCAGCLVRVECLTYALETDTQDGIFGGRTPPERRRIARHLRATA